MRTLAAFVLLVFTSAAAARGQALNPDFVHGRDYTFERMEVKRAVSDAEDKGTIRLVSYVYRPVKNDRREVVLFSHGSTGGMIRSPREPGDAAPPAVIRFFVSRGYTLVAPMRRGRGESSGTYIEECAFYLGQCTLAQQVELTDRQLKEALLDTNAVIDRLILPRIAGKKSGILVGGISRGGFLSLMLAGARPALVKGVVNFVGGWHSVSDKYSASDNKLRLEAQTARLARAAERAGAPSIWIYAVRDPFYTETTSREFFKSWTDSGGRGEFVFVGQHSLPSGHAVASDVSLWGPAVEAFLKTIEK